VDNTATVVTSDTGTTSSSSWTVNVTVPSAGCTLTIGYWKTHPDATAKLLPIWLGAAGGPKSIQVTTAAQATTILSFSGDASNGINKLDGQLLAAKLSIATGAGSSAVASTISAADAFLATHNSADWASLTKTQKTQVLGWATTLDNYNNGLTGPGHCSQ
jgi:roadblock/LC7 domain-containing protein